MAFKNFKELIEEDFKRIEEEEKKTQLQLDLQFLDDLIRNAELDGLPDEVARLRAEKERLLKGK